MSVAFRNVMINTGKTQVNSAPLSINFPLKCRTVQVKNPLQCRAPSTLANIQQIGYPNNLEVI
jgi:hypothetical protein